MKCLFLRLHFVLKQQSEFMCIYSPHKFLNVCTNYAYIITLNYSILISHNLQFLVFQICRTHGFILTVQDLSPNIGVLW